MKFSDEQLQQIIQGEIIGDFFPYLGGTNKQVVFYLKELVGRMERSRLLKFDADFRSYGSGYASYVDVFCYKKDGSSTENKQGTLWIDGISIYLCKHAPVAIFGPNKKTKGNRNGSYGTLSPYSIGEIPSGMWDEELKFIKEKIAEYKIEFLTKRVVKEQLLFETEIRTILNNDGYKVFDALFYWED
ncbi:hypothetical protein OB236_15485 [Paenibacillus sp. WQ 127069]|uniref:Restriction endonuclease n=1 Tax=Paenibacillus baimaensis TaxID=2982185 RepID=A0ABT2UFY0_9BACL|nr:hypothetical protein [Paenibacillus sp. WQ 127069]MCU6793507.1 hypothetical protein [Paenibacillus sp. WQ 127069]